MRWLVASLLGAAALADSASAALDFEPCPSTPDYECASLDLPLDPAGGDGDRLTLQLRRLVETREADEVLVALAGGPGQSSTRFIGDFADVLAEGLENRQLVVLDQRGTGDSGALGCAALEDANTQDSTRRLARRVGRCGEELGERRRFFTTTEVVEDLEALRKALEVERLSIYGISYGSYVAQRYARRYPERTDRLVLDSPVPQDQGGQFDRSSYEAVAGVLRRLCAGGSCRDITSSPVADMRRLARRLRRSPLWGRVHDDRGRSRPSRVESEAELFDLLVSTDFSPVMRASLPAAIRSALRDDAAPLLRLLALDQGTADSREFDEDNEDPRDFSNAVFFATTCQEKPLPWESPDAPVRGRHGRRRQALAALPPDAFEPFGARAAETTLVGTTLCERWPPTRIASVPEPGPIDAPALILSGLTDLRTPTAEARTAARLISDASLVTVPGAGHSLVSSRFGCVQTALRRFFAVEAVGSPCAGLPVRRRGLALAPLAPRRLGAIPLAGPQGHGARVAAALLETVRDAARIAAAQGTIDPPFAFGGLRGGSICVRAGPTGAAGDRSTILQLRRSSYVPGVVLSGAVRVDGRRIARLRLSISGPAAGRGWLVLRGRSLTGHLAARPLRLRLRRSHLFATRVTLAGPGRGPC